MGAPLKNVLIIDDEDAIREFVSFILIKEGFSVDIAQNGSEGLHKAQSNPPDLLITDLVMPEKEGIETIREFKTLYPDCPIIAMSGSVNSDTYFSVARLLGACQVIQKPFSRQELITAISAVLRLGSRNTSLSQQ